MARAPTSGFQAGDRCLFLPLPCLQFPERREDPLEVRRVRHLVLGIGVPDDAFLVHDEDRAAGAGPLIVKDPVGIDGLKLGVAEERVGEPAQGLGEALVRVQVVGADGQYLRAQLDESVPCLLKGGQLLGSTRGVVSRVEGHDRGSTAHAVAQAHRLTAGEGRQIEPRCQLARLNLHCYPPRSRWAGLGRCASWR